MLSILVGDVGNAIEFAREYVGKTPDSRDQVSVLERRWTFRAGPYQCLSDEWDETRNSFKKSEEPVSFHIEIASLIGSHTSVFQGDGDPEPHEKAGSTVDVNDQVEGDAETMSQKRSPHSQRREEGCGVGLSRFASSRRRDSLLDQAGSRARALPLVLAELRIVLEELEIYAEDA